MSLPSGEKAFVGKELRDVIKIPHLTSSLLLSKGKSANVYNYETTTIDSTFTTTIGPVEANQNEN